MCLGYGYGGTVTVKCFVWTVKPWIPRNSTIIWMRFGFSFSVMSRNTVVSCRPLPPSLLQWSPKKDFVDSLALKRPRADLQNIATSPGPVEIGRFLWINWGKQWLFALRQGSLPPYRPKQSMLTVLWLFLMMQLPITVNLRDYTCVSSFFITLGFRILAFKCFQSNGGWPEKTAFIF